MIPTDMTRTGKSKLTKIRTALPVIGMALVIIFACSYAVFASDNGLPANYVPNESDNRDLSDNTGQNRYGIPWHQFKNILTDETIKAQDIAINCSGPLEDLSIRVYNSTTQETEAVVHVGSSGILHLPRMKRGHTYILMSDNDDFIVRGASNIYLWALAAGDEGVARDGVYEHKTNYVRLGDNDPVPNNYLVYLTQIDMNYDSTGYYNPRYYSLYANLPVTYKGGKAPDGIRFRFTSAEGKAVEATTEDGWLKAELVEDTDYTVHVDDSRYDIDTFALAVKDKSEHKYIDSMTGDMMSYGRYCYDHTCCQGVSELKLVDRGSQVRQGSVASLKKVSGTNTAQTVVRGMDFKTMLLLVRYPAVSLPAGSGVTDYDAVELTLANPHRWEKCKITDVDFTVTQMLPQHRTVKNVYLLADGALKPLPFSQSNKEFVEFRMDSMSLHDVVIEYLDKEPEPEIKAPARTSIKKLKGAKRRLTVTWKRKNGVKGYQIQYSTKKSFKKAKTVTIKNSKTTKKTIKKLKRKKYYVRIRTYRTVNGKKYYSKWSKTKSVKVK